MTVDGKNINFVSVPRTVKRVGSRVASIVKTATKRMSNWYASKIKVEAFDKMSWDEQEKIIKKQEQYFDDKANRLTEKDASLASDRLEYDANQVLINEKENSLENYGMDGEHVSENLQGYIENLKNEKEELERRNAEIRESQEQIKNKVKEQLIADSDYYDLVKKHDEKGHETLKSVAQENLNEKSQEDQNIRIEENLNIRFSKLDDREEIDNIEASYLEKEDEIFDEIKEKLLKLLDDNREILSTQNTEKLNSIINIERDKRNSVLKSASEKIELLTSQNAELEDSLTNVQTDLGNSESENKRLESEIERLKSEKSLLEQQKEELISEKKVLHEELSDEKKKNTSLMNSIRKLEADKVNIQTAFGRDIMNLKDEKASEIKELEKKHEDEINALKEEINGLKIERSSIARILSGDFSVSMASNPKDREETITSLNDIKNNLTKETSSVDYDMSEIDELENDAKEEEMQIKKHK